MAKIIKDTRQVQVYSEDYRSGGWSYRTEEYYYCGNCEKELKTQGNFCPHCGEPLKGMRNKVEERRSQARRPYEKARNQLIDLRETLEKDSIAWKYMTRAIDDLWDKIMTLI